jgi:hypothetical protein
MDGLGATYEHFRGRSFDAFQLHLAVVATIAPFGLNVVINNETVAELDAIADFANAFGADELLLLPEQPTGDRAGISQSASGRLNKWISAARPAGLRLAISEAGTADGMPIANPFPGELPLDGHAHVDARGVLKPHAYATGGVPIDSSILESLDHLRTRRYP